MKKKISVAARRRLVLFGPICIFAIVYFCITIISYTNDLYHLQSKKNNLEQAYVDLQETEENLKIEKIKLQNPEYLASYAREYYSYSKNGELIIKKVTSNQIAEEPSIDTKDTFMSNKKVAVIALTVIVLTFIYILTKNKSKQKRIKF